MQYPLLFEIEDPSGIEDTQLWADKGAIDLFLNRTYALVMPQWPTLGGIHNTSDELNNINTTFLYGQLVFLEHPCLLQPTY